MQNRFEQPGASEAVAKKKRGTMSSLANLSNGRKAVLGLTLAVLAEAGCWLNQNGTGDQVADSGIVGGSDAGTDRSDADASETSMQDADASETSMEDADASETSMEDADASETSMEDADADSGDAGPCSPAEVCVTAPGCMKALHVNSADVIQPDSSPDNNSCEPSPKGINTVAGDMDMIAVKLSGIQTLKVQFPAGKTPVSIDYNCVFPAPSAGTAPTVSQMDTHLHDGVTTPLPVTSPFDHTASCGTEWAYVRFHF